MVADRVVTFYARDEAARARLTASLREFAAGMPPDVVVRLPEAMETPLASDGMPLVESELRRLMLARAIVGRPGLLIVDGILDALADDEAAELMKTLCDRRQPWTLLVATKRQALQSQCGRAVELLPGSEPQSVAVEA